ncbi:hypothetical protein EUGRSUZ_L01624 [Eucalyptus grandis]|uniref:Cytochrome P450 n=1 Tax=Eucalyptus grandis TaxID=71139 RepID=A0A058ZSN2_EUCGR|nr:hypothetical protein EUGRSUZ_L01624 [Eucalyptus grandis]
MDFLGFLLSIVVLFLSSILTKLLHKLWWEPIRVQRAMASQGIRGPPYKFIHGCTKEISKLKKDVVMKTNEPMTNVSHEILPIVEPHIQKWNKIYGGIYLHWYGPQAFLFISDTELVKEGIKKILGDGLRATEGKKWVRQRRLAHLASHGESLKGMIPATVDSVHTLLERWQKLEAKEVELFKEFATITSDAIHYAVFGIIEKRKENVKTGEMDDYGNDFLGSLLKAYHDPDKSKRITIDDLVDECKTFYFAGQETTNSTPTWTLFLLAIHKDWQEEARKEVTDVFGNEDPNHEGIMKLKTVCLCGLLSSCFVHRSCTLIFRIFNESLRLYPPATGIIRKVKRQVTLGNLVLPSGIALHIPILTIHHDPRIWGNDSHLFKPERFAEGITEATNNDAAAFLPFGLGPRSCVGLNFTMTEAKIALAMILQRYSFTLSPDYVHLLTQILTIRPQHGFKVILHPL